MKKHLALLAVVALATPIAFAADLQLDLVFDQPTGFGYTENQNIEVMGFASGDLGATDFLLKTPILKDAKDWAVGEYYVLLGSQPIVNYVAGQDATNLRKDLLELPKYSTIDLEGELEMKIPASEVNSGVTYFGIVVPVNDNILYGKYSKEFCFNFSSNIYGEGADCAAFAPTVTPEEVSSNGEGVGEELEHDAAGADMRLADISHSVQGNVVTLTWTAVPGSQNLEIKVFDKANADYITVATVPMSDEKYDYTFNDPKIEELLFAFIPRESNGKEVRYGANVRTEQEVEPEITTTPKVGPVEDMLMILGATLVLYLAYRAFASKKA